MNGETHGTYDHRVSAYPFVLAHCRLQTRLKRFIGNSVLQKEQRKADAEQMIVVAKNTKKLSLVCFLAEKLPDNLGAGLHVFCADVAMKH